MPSGVITLIIVAGSMFALFIVISTVGNYYSLNRIKNKTVGQDELTEEPENSSIEQNADKQRKVVIRTERPSQEEINE